VPRFSSTSQLGVSELIGLVSALTPSGLLQNYGDRNADKFKM
jgi:hypothetical protein